MFFKKNKKFNISRLIKINLNIKNIKFLKLNKNKIKFFGYLFNIKIKFINYIYIDIKNLNINYNNLIIYILKILIINILKGLNKYYINKLLIYGIGYKVIKKYNNLYFYLGYSYPLIYNNKNNLKIKIIDLTEIIIYSISKEIIFNESNFLKKIKKENKYKVKGIKFYNEILNLKKIKKK